MAGGCVIPDTCLAFNRRCWSFDLVDRSNTRPEIEPHTWTLSPDQALAWPISSKEKPDLIIFDPPYFEKKAGSYDEKSISSLPRKEYLDFFGAMFLLLKRNAKKSTSFAFINADWRDFQGKSVKEETGLDSILLDDYLDILKKAGWHRTHLIQAPMSAQRFIPVVVSAMQKRKSLGVTSRFVVILK